MNERVARISDEIRKLSPEEQADLLDELLAAVDVADLDFDRAWTEEVERRIAAHDNGEAVSQEAAEIVARLQTGFARNQ